MRKTITTVSIAALLAAGAAVPAIAQQVNLRGEEAGNQVRKSLRSQEPLTAEEVRSLTPRPRACAFAPLAAWRAGVVPFRGRFSGPPGPCPRWP